MFVTNQQNHGNFEFILKNKCNCDFVCNGFYFS